MQTSLRTPGSIWAKLIEQNNAAAKKPDGRGDAYVYFVGSRGAGKSTLLNRFLYPGRNEVPKPSEGLEYTYARKPSNFDHEKKDLAHIWEVGGTQEFADEFTKGEQLFLTVKQVTTAVVVVVVDLSDPSTALTTLLGWLEHVRKKLASTYEKFEKKGLQLPEQLRQRAKNKLYGSHEDKDIVWHSGISLVIAATKYDMLKDHDPEIKKVVARTLRWVAHAHGAFLMYLGSLHTLTGGEGGGGREGALERSLLDNFSRLLNHLIFTGLDKKPTLKLSPQMDHAGPLMVPAGVDKFRDIGRPRGAADGNVAAGQQEWRELLEKLCPAAQPKAKTAAKFEMDDRHREEDIDRCKERKLAELAAYRKEQEAAKELVKEMARKKAAAARAAASPAPAAGKSPSKAPPSSSTPSKATGSSTAASGAATATPSKATSSSGGSGAAGSTATTPQPLAAAGSGGSVKKDKDRDRSKVAAGDPPAASPQTASSQSTAPGALKAPAPQHQQHDGAAAPSKAKAPSSKPKAPAVAA